MIRVVRGWLLGLVMAAGCGGGRGAGPAAPGGDDAALRGLLRDPRAWPDAEVVVGRFGVARFTVDGDDAMPGHDLEAGEQPGDDTPVRYRVIDAFAGQVRILAAGRGLLLALWVPAADLRLVVTAPARLVSAPDAAAGDTGVTVGPGTAVYVAERRSGAAHVRGEAGAVRFDGWLPAAQLARFYRVADAAPPSRGMSVPRGARILDRPGGALVAVLTEDSTVEPVGDPDGGFQRVIHVRGVVRVDGYLVLPPPRPIRTYDEPEPGLDRPPPSIDAAHRVELPVGTCLYGSRAGRLVGADQGAGPQYGRDQLDGWWEVSVHTEWGVGTVWAHRGGDGWDRCG